MGYYFQAAQGQIQLLNKRQPVAGLIDDEATPEKLRQQLRQATAIRQYAIAQMHFNGDPGFSQYTDLQRPYVSWNVVAAPHYSVEPKTWCFPIAGCVAYKGYFKQSKAEQEKRALIEQGYDVLVYGVAAYSTLGWFDDPLLNTYINYPEADLAALLFHEISHQVVYLQDDSEFNEAFATAVEQVLLDRWLLQQNDAEEIEQISLNRQRKNRITEMVLEYRNRLIEAYEGTDPAADKQRLFGEMKQAYSVIKARGDGTRYYDWWFSRPLNNADLLTVSTYFRLVPAFSSMITQRNGDLPGFFDDVKELASKPKEERDQALAMLLALQN